MKRRERPVSVRGAVKSCERQVRSEGSSGERVHGRGSRRTAREDCLVVLRSSGSERTEVVRDE